MVKIKYNLDKKIKIKYILYGKMEYFEYRFKEGFYSHTIILKKLIPGQKYSINF